MLMAPQQSRHAQLQQLFQLVWPTAIYKTHHYLGCIKCRNRLPWHAGAGTHVTAAAGTRRPRRTSQARPRRTMAARRLAVPPASHSRRQREIARRRRPAARFLGNGRRQRRPRARRRRIVRPARPPAAPHPRPFPAALRTAAAAVPPARRARAPPPARCATGLGPGGAGTRRGSPFGAAAGPTGQGVPTLASPATQAPWAFC